MGVAALRISAPGRGRLGAAQLQRAPAGGHVPLGARGLGPGARGDRGSDRLGVAGLVFAFLPVAIQPAAAPPVPMGRRSSACRCSSSLRYLDRGRRRDAVLFGVAFAWNALCNVHYALFSGIPRRRDARRLRAAGRERRGRRLRGALVAAALGGLRSSVPFALPYREASPPLRNAAVPRRGRDVFGAVDRFLSAETREPAVRSGRPLAGAGRRGIFFQDVPLAVGARRAGRRALRREGPGRSAAAPETPRPGGAARARVWTYSRRLVAPWAASASLGRVRLRVGPLHLGDPGRILVLLTALVPARGSPASRWTNARRSRRSRATRSPHPRALLLAASSAPAGC